MEQIMTLPTLYELSQTYREALETLTDPEADIPVEAVNDTLEALSGELQEKATNIAKFMRNLDTTVQAIKDAEEQMARRRKAIERRTQWLRDYLKYHMEASGITKIESPWFVLAIQKNPPAVEIVDESELPKTFCKEIVTLKPDKVAIKECLQRGEAVNGARLVQGTRLVVK